MLRIITWNVNSANKNLDNLLNFAYSKSPDILCLQEIPLHKLNQLKHNPAGMFLLYTQDFTSHKKARNSFICTLSKIKPSATNEIIYSYKRGSTIINKIYYQSACGREEQHKAIEIKISHNQKEINIANARISCAVSAKDRISYIKTFLEKLEPNGINIVCGDLNIIDNPKLSKATGWLRGFRKCDYSIDERANFESLCTQMGFKNIFLGTNTTFLPKPALQLDHIVIPKSINYSRKKAFKERFGSDHKMLLLDVDV